MRPLAIFYHAVISGGETNVQPSHSIQIMAEQMGALESSGLLSAAQEFHIGVNGDEADLVTAGLMALDRARMTCHGPSARSEITTMRLIEKWLPAHPGWYVLYFHMKGVTAPGQKLREDWRKCMMNAVVWRWRECIAAMDGGVDSCGCHWLTPERWGSIVKSPFWGGTFWWAKSEFLRTLPPLPEPSWANRYEAESWIGRGPTRPTVLDFHPDWPGAGCNA